MFVTQANYAANEIQALRWVHGASWHARLGMYERVVRPLTVSERERFWAETKLYALCFGIPRSDLPATFGDLRSYVADMCTNGQLAPSAPGRAVMDFLRAQLPLGVRDSLLAFNSL